MQDAVLIGFSAAEEEMIRQAMEALGKVCYDVSVFQELIKVNDMPTGYRAMSLEGGAALGNEAFESQDWLIHV